MPALEPGKPGGLAGPGALTGLRPARQRSRGVDRRALEHVRGHLASPAQPADLAAALVETDAGIGGPAVLPGVHVIDERHLRPRQRRGQVGLGHPIGAFSCTLVEVGHGPSDAVVVRQPGGARMGQEGLVLFAVRVQGEPNVVARDRGTPVWETSTRLASPTMASLGTTLMVPEATDSAVVTKWDTPP